MAGERISIMDDLANLNRQTPGVFDTSVLGVDEPPGGPSFFDAVNPFAWRTRIDHGTIDASGPLPDWRRGIEDNAGPRPWWDRESDSWVARLLDTIDRVLKTLGTLGKWAVVLIVAVLLLWLLSIVAPFIRAVFGPATSAA